MGIENIPDMVEGLNKDPESTELGILLLVPKELKGSVMAETSFRDTVLLWKMLGLKTVVSPEPAVGSRDERVSIPSTNAVEVCRASGV